MSARRSLRVRVVAGIDTITRYIGRAVAWLTLCMVLVTFAVVVMRYLFNAGEIWLQEIYIYLHALVFMLGAGYTLQADEHVRVDVFYNGASPIARRRVNVIGTVVFLLPICGFIIWISLPYVIDSWRNLEASPESDGLPFPAVSLLKTAIPITAALLALQGLAELLRPVRATSEQRIEGP